MATYGFRMVFLSAARCTYQTHLLSRVQNAELTTCLTSAILRGRFLSLQSRSYLDRKKMKYSQIKRLKWWDIQKYLASLEKLHMAEKKLRPSRKEGYICTEQGTIAHHFLPSQDISSQDRQQCQKESNKSNFQAMQTGAPNTLTVFCRSQFPSPADALRSERLGTIRKQLTRAGPALLHWPLVSGPARCWSHFGHSGLRQLRFLEPLVCPPTAAE